jgi:hypothetical protein
MSEPEQCIICLDSLPRPYAKDKEKDKDKDSAPPPLLASGVSATVLTTTTPADSPTDEEDVGNYLNIVAALDGCEHIIHDACIRSWAQKTNTCPICRNIFHTVRVYNGVDGKLVMSRCCSHPP